MMPNRAANLWNASDEGEAWQGNTGNNTICQYRSAIGWTSATCSGLYSALLNRDTHDD